MTDPLPIRPFTRKARGGVRIPGSKSITNRALVLAALADGETRLGNCLFSEDTEIMANALGELGIVVERDAVGKAIRVAGCGGAWPVKEAALFVGNAGTVARFLTAMLCLHPAACYHIDGTLVMRKRPMQGLLEALRRLGARITCHGREGHFPFTIETSGLPGGIWEVDASQSSQILSALLMVAPLAQGQVELKLDGKTVSKPFVQMTLDMMHDFGASVSGESLVKATISNT